MYNNDYTEIQIKNISSKNKEEKMKQELNEASKEKLEERTKINTLPDEKNFDGGPNGGGKPGAVKNLRGFWTDAQIAENPLAYIAYLRKQLEGEYHNDKIRDIISEIEDIEEKYVKTEEEKALGRNR